jgi:hypothetical protein
MLEISANYKDGSVSNNQITDIQTLIKQLRKHSELTKITLKEVNFNNLDLNTIQSDLNLLGLFFQENKVIDQDSSNKFMEDFIKKLDNHITNMNINPDTSNKEEKILNIDKEISNINQDTSKDEDEKINSKKTLLIQKLLEEKQINSNDKALFENSKNPEQYFKDYLKALNAEKQKIEKLQALCDGYIAHLRKALYEIAHSNKDKAGNEAAFQTLSAKINLAVSMRAHLNTPTQQPDPKLVNVGFQTNTPQSVQPTKLSAHELGLSQCKKIVGDFSAVFNDLNNRETLIKDRDPASIVFTKKILGILLAPVYFIPKLGPKILDKLMISRGHKAVHDIYEVCKAKRP